MAHAQHSAISTDPAITTPASGLSALAPALAAAWKTPWSALIAASMRPSSVSYPVAVPPVPPATMAVRSAAYWDLLAEGVDAPVRRVPGGRLLLGLRHQGGALAARLLRGGRRAEPAVRARPDLLARRGEVVGEGARCRCGR